MSLYGGGRDNPAGSTGAHREHQEAPSTLNSAPAKDPSPKAAPADSKPKRSKADLGPAPEMESGAVGAGAGFVDRVKTAFQASATWAMKRFNGGPLEQGLAYAVSVVVLLALGGGGFYLYAVATSGTPAAAINPPGPVPEPPFLAGVIKDDGHLEIESMKARSDDDAAYVERVRKAAAEGTEDLERATTLKVPRGERFIRFVTKPFEIQENVSDPIDRTALDPSASEFTMVRRGSPLAIRHIRRRPLVSPAQDDPVFTYSFDEKGRLIAFQGVWETVQEVEGRKLPLHATSFWAVRRGVIVARESTWAVQGLEGKKVARSPWPSATDVGTDLKTCLEALGVADVQKVMAWSFEDRAGDTNVDKVPECPKQAAVEGVLVADPSAPGVSKVSTEVVHDGEVLVYYHAYPSEAEATSAFGSLIRVARETSPIKMLVRRQRRSIGRCVAYGAYVFTEEEPIAYLHDKKPEASKGFAVGIIVEKDVNLSLVTKGIEKGLTDMKVVKREEFLP